MDKRSSISYATLIGGAFWCLLIPTILFLPRDSDTNASPLRSIAAHLIQPATTVKIRMPEHAAKKGDPIFFAEPTGEFRQVGHVLRHDSDPEIVTAQWYGSVDTQACGFVYHHNRGTLAEAAELLLPPDRRKAISAKLAAAYREHSSEVLAAFQPIVEQTLRESVPVIQQGITESVGKHRPELVAIGNRYETELINQRVVPLMREEVLPIVRRHGEPVAKEIGLEIWERASLFRFGWRIIYDKSPLPERDLTEQEWDRFVEQEAVPVFESYVNDIVAALKEIIKDTAKNQAVRNEFAGVLKGIAGDKELQAVVGKILGEAIIKNEALRKVWIDNWQSPRAKAALELANDRLEPIVREIGDEIFGTREEGINPGFARVLRNQILGKDRRWIEARRLTVPRHEDSIAEAVAGEGTRPFPLLFYAGEPDES